MASEPGLNCVQETTLLTSYSSAFKVKVRENNNLQCVGGILFLQKVK